MHLSFQIHGFLLVPSVLLSPWSWNKPWQLRAVRAAQAAVLGLGAKILGWLHQLLTPDFVKASAVAALTFQWPWWGLRQFLCWEWSFQAFCSSKKNAAELFRGDGTITAKRNAVSGGWGSEAQFPAQGGFPIDAVLERRDLLQSGLWECSRRCVPCWSK